MQVHAVQLVYQADVPRQAAQIDVNFISLVRDPFKGGTWSIDFDTNVMAILLERNISVRDEDTPRDESGPGGKIPDLRSKYEAIY